MYDNLIIAAVITAVVLLIILFIRRKIEDNKLMNSVTDRSRGTRAERRLVVSLLRNDVPSDDIYHDLYLEYRPGYYAQLDVVVVTPTGLVVFEEKDYSGWIFGKGWQNQWTQVLNYGKEKNHFYNPVKQNEGHINRLKSVLGAKADGVRFISYIIFHGDCEFRDVSEIPQGVIVDYAIRLGKTMKKIYELPRTDYPDLPAIRRVLREAQRNGQNPQVIQRHLANIRRYKDK